MSFFIEDNSLENKDLLKNESVFHIANGYIGIRGNFEEGYDEGFDSIRGAYINGFYEVNKIQYGEKLYGFPNSKESILNVIDSQNIELYIGEERFSLFQGTIIDYKRLFNLEEGYVERRVHWKSPKGYEFKIKIKRMTSFTTLELFLTTYEVESVNYSGDVTIVSKVDGAVSNYVSNKDPRVGTHNGSTFSVQDIFMNNDISTITLKTKNSKLQVSCNTSHKLNCSHNMVHKVNKSNIESIISFRIVPERGVSLTKYVVYTDSIRHNRATLEGYQLCEKISQESAEFYFENQKEYLKNFWDSANVTIEGNEVLQQGIHYNIYQLLQSVGKDKFSNICAKGLSGEGYEGHYFWDTEIYMLPFFLLTAPEIAKNLLLYRYGILDSARKRARELGHKTGALFPWRTITGRECSPYFPAGTAQYHINGDIAYSFIKYYEITGDIDFIINYGAEVLDCGVGLLSMHAPYEVASKADIFEMYRGYKAFFNINL